MYTYIYCDILHSILYIIRLYVFCISLHYIIDIIIYCHILYYAPQHDACVSAGVRHVQGAPGDIYFLGDFRASTSPVGVGGYQLTEQPVDGAWFAMDLTPSDALWAFGFGDESFILLKVNFGSSPNALKS